MKLLAIDECGFTIDKIEISHVVNDADIKVRDKIIEFINDSFRKGLQQCDESLLEFVKSENLEGTDGDGSN